MLQRIKNVIARVIAFPIGIWAGIAQKKPAAPARRKRRLRWDRIIVAALLLVLLLVGLIAGIVALFRGGKEPKEDASESTGESVSDSASDSESESAPPPTVQNTAWELLLVNARCPLPTDYTVETAMLENSLTVDARILEPLNTMLAAAKEQGVELIVCSAYRDIAYQSGLYQDRVSEFISEGYSQTEAEKAAAAIVAVPGTSEHNTGLSVDIVTPSYQVLDMGFAETDAAVWLAANAPKYGFILRYAQDKVDITGCNYEPWHFRYVGSYAQAITESGLCLEEWLQQNR